MQITARQNESQQEWYREGEQPVVSCMMQEKAGFFDFYFFVNVTINIILTKVMNGSSRTAKALRELRGGATQWLESVETRPGTELWKHEKR